MISHLRRNALFFAISGWLLLAGATSRAAETSVKDLIGLLNSPDAATQLKAIDELGTQGEKAAEAVAPLTALLKNSSAPVRAHAAQSLGKIGAPAKSAAADLTALTKDADATVRQQAVKAIVAIRPGPQVMIPLIVKLHGGL